MEKSRDIIIFGAGQIGRMALVRYKDRVLFIVDNNIQLQGTFLEGIMIKSVASAVTEKNCTVLIASKHQELMERQLQELGITGYKFYLEEKEAYYDTMELVFNPYEDNPKRDVTEEMWNKNSRQDFAIETINYRVEQMQGKKLLFDHVEIETVNRCNGSCEFCPVNRKNDKREYQEMSESLFENIIEQLSELNYTGKLALFSNNEPFLDTNIIEKYRYARKKLPNARTFLFTNGTLLTIDKFTQIIPYLDELIIDNYQQDLKLIKPCKEIVDYCEEHTELKKKVTIVLRKPNEILSTRGGDAPNRVKMLTYGDVRCILPYRQLIIRPDGKVSLCCNDPYGKTTLGDLAKNRIIDVWNNENFQKVRKCLYDGRANLEHCRFCDALNLGGGLT